MLQLRKATKKDVKFYHALKNDPVVLANSYVIRDPVPFEQYKKWFYEALQSPQKAFWVVLDNDIPIGDVRLDIGKEYELSIRLKPLARGKGYGKVALLALIVQASQLDLISETYAPYSIRIPQVAYIVDGNIASMRLFLSCGFVPISYERGPVIGRYKFIKR